MIITRWNNPRLANNVEKILRYPDPLIRREVIRTLAGLKPSGPATKLIPMLNDPDEGVRLATLKVAAHRQLFGSIFELGAYCQC